MIRCVSAGKVIYERKAVVSLTFSSPGSSLKGHEYLLKTNGKFIIKQSNSLYISSIFSSTKFRKFQLSELKLY